MRKFVVLITLILSVNQITFTQLKPFSINHGPYLQYLTTDEVTIIWTTTGEAVSWVEFFADNGSHFYQTERPKIFAATNGLKDIGRIHKVTLSNLKPGTRYLYRIYSKEVLDRNYSNPVFGRTIATDVYRRQPLAFTSNGVNKEKTLCIVLADMHNNSSKIAGLLSDVNWDEADFVVSNGDFVGTFNREEDIFSGGLDTCVNIFATGKPIYFVRGNHETRGNLAHNLKNYVHSPNGEYFYTFKSGKTLFIVLDGGEDKPDSDIEYNELVDFDPYRSKVAEWLKEVSKSDEFKSSEYKIVFNHIPPFFPGRSAWHGDTEVREKYVPILNEAGIDLMISGHTHRYALIDRKTGENDFPIIVMNNNCRMDLLIDGTGINTTITDLDKKVLLKYQIQ